MREMAKVNDFKTFKTGLTRNLSDRDAKQLFDAVKKGMGLKERYESFTDFLNNDLREEYYQEKIFNVGEMVEHVDGSTGTIVRRGTNYVSYESDGLVKKAWLYDIQMSEEPRIPRKKGQPAGSDKHSDLYTDENPKGTIKGLGFKDVETARASVNKIKNSGKTHAHKIQAAVAMEQRAKEMGKSAEAKIYRTYIDKMKEKTKAMQKESLLGKLENELGSADEYFDLNQISVKTANEAYEIGQDYAQHTMAMTPGQPVLSFKLANKVIERKDIDNFANEDKIIDKYKKRYGDRWEDELEKAVIRMKKEL
jgi:hypothetical protein